MWSPHEWGWSLTAIRAPSAQLAPGRADASSRRAPDGSRIRGPGTRPDVAVNALACIRRNQGRGELAPLAYVRHLRTSRIKVVLRYTAPPTGIPENALRGPTPALQSSPGSSRATRREAAKTRRRPDSLPSLSLPRRAGSPASRLREHRRPRDSKESLLVSSLSAPLQPDTTPLWALISAMISASPEKPLFWAVLVAAGAGIALWRLKE